MWSSILNRVQTMMCSSKGQKMFEKGLYPLFGAADQTDGQRLSSRIGDNRPEESNKQDQKYQSKQRSRFPRHERHNKCGRIYKTGTSNSNESQQRARDAFTRHVVFVATADNSGLQGLFPSRPHEDKNEPGLVACWKIN